MNDAATDPHVHGRSACVDDAELSHLSVKASWMMLNCLTCPWARVDDAEFEHGFQDVLHHTVRRLGLVVRRSAW